MGPELMVALVLGLAGRELILSWPTNSNGFTLQSTTNLLSPVWVTNSLGRVTVNGLKTVPNPISGAPQFYRLKK